MKVCYSILFSLAFLLYADSTHAQTWQSAYDSCLKYQEQQQYKKALEWGDKAITLYEKQVTQKDTNYSNILSAQFENCYQAGMYNKALEFAIKDSIYTSQNYGKKNKNFAISYVKLAKIYNVQGYHSEAERIYIEIKNTLASTVGKEDYFYGTICNDLALLYTFQGRYSEAEPLFMVAKTVYSTVVGKKHFSYAVCCNNLAILYEKQGRYDEAISLFKEAITTYNNLGIKDNYYANFCNNLANLYKIYRYYSESETLYKEAKIIYDKKGGRKQPNYANFCDNLGDLYQLQNRYREAESLKVEAKIIRTDLFGKEHFYYAMSCNNLANLYYAQNRYREAESLYMESKKIYAKTLGKKNNNYTVCCKNLASLYLKQGRFNEAESLYIEIYNIKQEEIEQNFKYLSEAEKEKYLKANLEKITDNFFKFILYRYAQNPAISGFGYQLAITTKGLILNTTEKIKQRILKSNDKELKNLFLEWKATRDKYNRTLNLTIEQRKEKKLNLDSLEKRANELEKQLALKSEDFANVFTPKPVTWQDIQAKLKKDEASIEIISFEMKKDSVVYMAMVLKKDSKYPEIVQFADGNALETKYLTSYRRSIINKTKDEDNYNVFWKPLKNSLKGIKTVYFSAEGIYHQINLATLQNPETKKYVFDEVRIIPVTNTKDIVENKRNYNNKAIHLIGNPKYNLNLDLKDNEKPEQNRSIENLSQLEGAEKEVKQASNYFQNASVTIGEPATEEFVKSLKNPRILHIATHGYFKKGQYQSSTQAMLNGGLLFAGVVDYDRMYIRPFDKDDGKLTAFEVMNMELDSTELVVLSACETGLGQASKDGVYGLQRAFKVAGVQTIIMSLWKVNDEATQLLMTEFYQNWQKKGMDKRKAFETAQKTVRKQYKDPYYWGAFVMIE